MLFRDLTLNLGYGTSKKGLIKLLEHMQRVCLLAITGAMKITSTKALDVILGFRSINM